MTTADLPDEAMVPMKWVRANYVPKANAELRDMTTQELAADFGHSADWWRDRAGGIPGAYQSGPHARWYIPRRAATVFLNELKAKKTRRSRKPWKGAQAA